MNFQQKKHFGGVVLIFGFFSLILINISFIGIPKAGASIGCGVDCWQQNASTCKMDDTSLDNSKGCTINQPVREDNVSGGTSCSSGIGVGSKWCGQGACPSGAKGLLTLNGARCDILDSEAIAYPVCKEPFMVENGKWDANEGYCVGCFDKQEIIIYGTTTGIGNSVVAQRCESACGADFDCDEQFTDLFIPAAPCEGPLRGYCGHDSDCDYDKLCRVGCGGATADCNAKKVGEACTILGNPGTCDAGCACAPTAGLVLTASASPTSIALSGTSIITFTVKKDGTPVNVATVSGIAVTAGLGSVAPASCVTAGAGTCTVTYTAPAAATIATVSATKASNGVDTDSGPASASVTVTTCSNPDFSQFDDYQYNLNDVIRLDGQNGGLIYPIDFALCIYNDAGNLMEEGIFYDVGGPRNISIQATSTGTWKGLAVAGGGGCNGTFDINDGCPSSTDVVGAACTANGGGCGGNSNCCSNNCSGGTCQAACVVSGPENCAVAGDEDCANGADCTDSACPNGTLCSGTNFCDTGACVECTISNLSNCASDEVCNLGSCSPCKGEGDAASGLSQCCKGLSWIDGICTSKCDPRTGFFCNPLRGTVEDIVQGGQKLIGYVLGLVGSIALLFIVIAGMMYMTSAGNEERIASSKRILTGAIIGIAITLLAYSFLQVIITILNM